MTEGLPALFMVSIPSSSGMDDAKETMLRPVGTLFSKPNGQAGRRSRLLSSQAAATSSALAPGT